MDEFVTRIETEPPPLARIESVTRIPLDDGESAPDDFQILLSQSGAARTSVSADMAVCPQCLEEVFDPNNRRYRYPFTNCTHCGPRLSIISAIPYDRANTSMEKFTLCKQCRKEYEDPTDRRFHAQPTPAPTVVRNFG